MVVPKPLTRLAGTTLTRASSASGPETSTPASSSASSSFGTSASDATTPTDPSRFSASRTAATTAPGTSAGSATTRFTTSPSGRRERAAGTSTSSRLSSRLVSSTTACGTRNPVVSGTTAASGRPRWRSVPSQERAAQGVVPCARSPSTVSDPKAALRAMALHSIGDRSCASSTTTWPYPSGCPISPATSSSSSRSAADQAAERHDRGGRAHSRARCSSASRIPPAARPNRSASDSTSATTCSGRTSGQTASTYAVTPRARSIRRTQAAPRGPLRRSAWSWTARTIRARTRSRPTAYGGRSSSTPVTIRASASPSTRHRYEPSGTARGSP